MGFAYSPDNDNRVGRRRPAGSIAGFALFTAAGIAALACAVLLPEYAVLADLRTQQDILAHQVGCDEKLAAYNSRMIRAACDDPVLIARLMIRHSNYRPAGFEAVETGPLPPAPSVPERLLHQASNPPQRRQPSIPAKAGLWLADRTTNGCIILLSLAMIVAGATLFSQRAPQRSVITHFK